MIGWNNVSEMTKFGMPGVFTHGNFDTWSPGYLMFIAALHNGISRLLRDVRQRRRRHGRALAAPEPVRAHLVPTRTRRCRRRCGPSATTTTTRRPGSSSRCTYFAAEQPAIPAQLLPEEQALDPKGEDEAARPPTCCRPTTRARARRPSCSACCRNRASRFRARPPRSPSWCRRRSRRRARAPPAGRRRRRPQAPRPRRPTKKTEPLTRQFPAGSSSSAWTSRTADRRRAARLPVLEPDDPQKKPYDDTGWTFRELFDVEVVARRRYEGAGRADGAGRRRGEGARRRRGTGSCSSSTTTPTPRSRRCATA